MADRTIVVAEEEDDVIYLVCAGPKGVLEVMANIAVEGRTIILENLHIGGPGANSFGMAELRAFARLFAEQRGMEWIEIRGATRTTGACPGHRPRSIRIRVT